MGVTEVLTVRGEDELIARAGHLFVSARDEFLCAATDLDTWDRNGIRDRLAERMHAAGPTGRVRKLFSLAVLADEAGVAHLSRLAGPGREIRICAAELPHETIVIDRRLAILAGDRVGGVRTFTVVRTPALVTGVRALFDAAWEQAAPLADHLRGDAPALRPESRAILRQLATGRKDEVAARELGLSLRTYRRRVAELMAVLGAESRFQAGARARALGL